MKKAKSITERLLEEELKKIDYLIDENDTPYERTDEEVALRSLIKVWEEVTDTESNNPEEEAEELSKLQAYWGEEHKSEDIQTNNPIKVALLRQQYYKESMDTAIKLIMDRHSASKNKKKIEDEKRIAEILGQYAAHFMGEKPRGLQRNIVTKEEATALIIFINNCEDSGVSNIKHQLTKENHNSARNSNKPIKWSEIKKELSYQLLEKLSISSGGKARLSKIVKFTIKLVVK